MILNGGLITQTLAGEGGSAILSNITISQNGEYTPFPGTDGFDKVTVKVLPNVKELKVEKNGTYNAADYSCDGFDPVIVNSPYEDLYKWATDQNDDYDTGLTDPDGNEVIIATCLPVGNEEDLEQMFEMMGVLPEVTVTDTVSGISVRLYNDVSEPWGSGMGYSTKVKAFMRNVCNGDNTTVTQYNSYNGGDPDNFIGIAVTGITITQQGDYVIVHVDFNRVLKDHTQSTYVEGTLDNTGYDSANCNWVIG